MVHYVSDLIGRGLRAIQAAYPDWMIGIRQNGLVMGLEFAHPEGAKYVMRHLYDNGVWAIFSTLDPRVLQFKPGILMTPELSEELLGRIEVAIGQGLAGSHVGAEGSGHERDSRRPDDRARRRAEGARHAAAGAMGGAGLLALRQGQRRPHRLGRRPRRGRQGPGVRRVGRERDRLRGRRAQGRKEPHLQHGHRRGLSGPRLRLAALRPDGEDPRDPPAGGRRARAHAFDQPGRDRVLQVARCAS